MGYYMLFQHSPGAASDTPLGIHVRKADVNALCVFSSGEAAAFSASASARALTSSHLRLKESIRTGSMTARMSSLLV
jgi:hypothetical protein